MTGFDGLSQLRMAGRVVSLVKRRKARKCKRQLEQGSDGCLIAVNGSFRRLRRRRPIPRVGGVRMRCHNANKRLADDHKRSGAG